MSGAATEGALRDWRYGQPQAERLTAALLHLEGYEDVDPQHPLGGPDGIKDVLCRRNGVLWVAAAYFPPTPVTFAAIRKKLGQDIKGVVANGLSGFAFFVNQRVSISERQELHTISPAPRTEIYHLERLVALLNSPRGCGIRLEYLRIPMTEEEQWSFWSHMNADLTRQMSETAVRQSAEIEKLALKMDALDLRTRLIREDIQALPSTIASRPRLVGISEPPTSTLTIDELCWLHRIVTEGSGVPEADRGRFRGVEVRVGAAGSSDGEANLLPTPHAQIATEFSGLLEWWHRRHAELCDEDKAEIALGLADFHHRFFLIHPFIDGNGRVARLLLDQAARELLDQGISKEFTAPPTDYYATLLEANKGNIAPLSERILAALE